MRALRSIIEGILLDLLYELPSRKDTDRFVVDAAVVRGDTHLARGLTAADLEAEEDDEAPVVPSPSASEEEDAGERESA